MHATPAAMYALMLLTALAFLVPWITAGLERWVKLPSVVIEIALGMLIGRAGLDLFQDADLGGVQFLALIGFNYLMFLSGLELDFTVLGSFRLRNGDRDWRHLLREPFAIALLSFAGTLLIAGAAALAINSTGLLGTIPATLDTGDRTLTPLVGQAARVVLLALIFSTTSLGVVLPTLKDARLLGSDYGQTILVAVMAADFGTLLLLALLESGVHAEGGLAASVLIVSTLLLLYLVFRWLGFRVRGVALAQRLFERFAHGTSQIKIRGAFALIMVFVAYSFFIEAEAILGAFLAGALISFFTQHRDSEMHQKLDAIGYGFFVPLFFLNVGMEFQGGGMFSASSGVVVLLLLLVGRVCARVLPAQLFRLRFDGKRSLAAGWLLTAQLSLTVAASQIGLRLGLIDSVLNGQILLLAILTCLGGPLLFNRLYKPTPAEPEGPRHIVIIGSGQMAMFLGRRLRRQGFSTILIDHRRERLQQAEQLGCTLCYEDPRTVSGLIAAGTDYAFAVIAASGQDLMNLAACRLATSVFGCRNVVARVQNQEYLNEYEELGVRAVDAVTAMFTMLDLLAVNPEVLGLATNVEDDHLIREAAVFNPVFNGRHLYSLDLPGDCMLLGLHRNGSLLVPHGDTRLELGDRVVLIGSEQAVQEALLRFENPGFSVFDEPSG